jgi:hypothetical protein
VCVKCRTFLHVYNFFEWNSVMQTVRVRGVQSRLWLLSFWISSTVSYSGEIKMFREIGLVRKQICSASLTPMTANSSSVRTNHFTWRDKEIHFSKHFTVVLIRADVKNLKQSDPNCYHLEDRNILEYVAVLVTCCRPTERHVPKDCDFYKQRFKNLMSFLSPFVALRVVF